MLWSDQSLSSSKPKANSICKMRFEPVVFRHQGHDVLLLPCLHFIKWSFCAVWSWAVLSTCSGHCVPSSPSSSFRPLPSVLFHAAAECHGLKQGLKRLKTGHLFKEHHFTAFSKHEKNKQNKSWSCPHSWLEVNPAMKSARLTFLLLFPAAGLAEVHSVVKETDRYSCVFSSEPLNIRPTVRRSWRSCSRERIHPVAFFGRPPVLLHGFEPKILLMMRLLLLVFFLCADVSMPHIYILCFSFSYFTRSKLLAQISPPHFHTLCLPWLLASCLTTSLNLCSLVQPLVPHLAAGNLKSSSFHIHFFPLSFGCCHKEITVSSASIMRRFLSDLLCQSVHLKSHLHFVLFFVAMAGHSSTIHHTALCYTQLLHNTPQRLTTNLVVIQFFYNFLEPLQQHTAAYCGVLILEI